VSHLHHQRAAFIQVRRRFSDDAAHQIEPVASARERERGLPAIFGGQRAHHGFADVRRIGHDQVVALVRQSAEQIRLDEHHAAA
jgi:hypothetical protein